mgnify:CR=1 FL=1
MPYTTVDKGAAHFNTLTFTGNESAGHAVTGVGFKPDFTWFKNRGGTDSHSMYDIVRGVTKQIESDTNGAESTESTGLASFDTDGFTVGTRTASNSNNMSICSWNWLAGGSQGSSNTDGSINTTYTSVNTTAGISIIEYNGNGTGGATIGHGLGVAPKLVWIKRLDTTSNWIFGSAALGFNKFLYLNTTDSATTNSGTFNDTAPDNSVITLGTWNDVNNSSGRYICYAFAEKAGFTKGGLFNGNGNADGPFLQTGFKPSFFIIKNYGNSSERWSIYDNRRLGYNDSNYRLVPSDNTVEATETKLDFLSNGIKIKSAGDGHLNNNGHTFVWWAFAEAPIVGSNNTPATAR